MKVYVPRIIPDAVGKLPEEAGHTITQYGALIPSTYPWGSKGSA